MDMLEPDRATVRIEYCSECFDMPLAVRVAQEILTEYEERIDELILVPSGGGGFDVKVDGRFAFSRAGAGRNAREGEIVQNVGEKLPPQSPNAIRN
jgi:selenoprotein W-related protein